MRVVTGRGHGRQATVCGRVCHSVAKIDLSVCRDTSPLPLTHLHPSPWVKTNTQFQCNCYWPLPPNERNIPFAPFLVESPHGNQVIRTIVSFDGILVGIVPLDTCGLYILHQDHSTILLNSSPNNLLNFLSFRFCQANRQMRRFHVYKLAIIVFIVITLSNYKLLWVKIGTATANTKQEQAANHPQ